MRRFALTSMAMLVAVLFAGMWTAGQATQESPVDILRKSEAQVKGTSSHAVYEMQVVKPDFTRSFTMEGWWVAENEKALITVLEPRREAGNKTLKIEDEIWMYLRNTETTIKIPPSMMLQSWNGSDFTFDDLVREADLVNEYSTAKLADETIDGTLCFQLELIPNDDAPALWAKIRYWVRHEDYLPQRMCFYDDKGRLVRTQDFKGHKVIGGRKVPTQYHMRNELEPGDETIMIIREAEFDIEIPQRLFSLQALER